MCHSFIHSFNHSGSFYSAFSSPLLFRGAPDTARILCFTTKRQRQLRVKDLPKISMWRLKRDWNLRPFGRKASNLPMSHHATHQLAVFTKASPHSISGRQKSGSRKYMILV